jgi:hypothetical protein
MSCAFECRGSLKRKRAVMECAACNATLNCCLECVAKNEVCLPCAPKAQVSESLEAIRAIVARTYAEGFLFATVDWQEKWSTLWEENAAGVIVRTVTVELKFDLERTIDQDRDVIYFGVGHLKSLKIVDTNGFEMDQLEKKLQSWAPEHKFNQTDILRKFKQSAHEWCGKQDITVYIVETCEMVRAGIAFDGCYLSTNEFAVGSCARIELEGTAKCTILAASRELPKRVEKAVLKQAKWFQGDHLKFVVFAYW